MAYPAVPVPGYSYTSHQEALGDDSFPGTPLDADLFNVFTALGTITEFLKASIRSDGLLNNKVVTPDSLAASTRRLLGAMWTPRGEWDDVTAYVPGDVVSVSGPSYVCVTAHTSTAVFNDDLADGLWMLFAAETVVPAPSPSDVGKIQRVIAPGVLALVEAAVWALPAAPDADKIAIATGAGTVGFSSTTVASLLASLAANAAAISALDSSLSASIASLNTNALLKTGGTLTAGTITLFADAVAALQAMPRRQVGWENIIQPIAVSGLPTNIDIVIPAGFTRVKVEWDNLLPTAGAPILRTQLSANGGSSWISGGSDYASFGVVQVGVTATDYGTSEGAASLARATAGTNISAGEFTLALSPRGVGRLHTTGYVSGYETRTGSFVCQTASAINAIRLLWDTGTTFAGGTVTVQGVRAP